MELPTIDNTDAYIDVCKKANLPVNKLPKKGDKLDLAYEIALKEINPHLYQNLMSPNADDLPADVAKRYKQGLMWIDDLQSYLDCGFTGTAQNIRDAIAEAQTQKMINETKAMEERNKARDEYHRNRPKGMQFGAPLPPEQVQHFRDQIGYTGLADWQK